MAHRKKLGSTTGEHEPIGSIPVHTGPGTGAAGTFCSSGIASGGLDPKDGGFLREMPDFVGRRQNDEFFFRKMSGKGQENV